MKLLTVLTYFFSAIFLVKNNYLRYSRFPDEYNRLCDYEQLKRVALLGGGSVMNINSPGGRFQLPNDSNYLNPNVKKTRYEIWFYNLIQHEVNATFVLTNSKKKIGETLSVDNNYRFKHGRTRDFQFLRNKKGSYQYIFSYPEIRKNKSTINIEHFISASPRSYFVEKKMARLIYSNTSYQISKNSYQISEINYNLNKDFKNYSQNSLNKTKYNSNYWNNITKNGYYSCIQETTISNV